MKNKGYNSVSTTKKVLVLSFCILFPVALISIPILLGKVSDNKNDSSLKQVESQSKVSSLQEENISSEKQKLIDSADFIDERNLAMVLKDPDSHTGKVFKVWGQISQFDSATGKDRFRAYVSTVNQTYWALNGKDVVVTGDSSILTDFVKEDIFVATVEAKNSQTYDNAMGGGTTSPVLTVYKIERK